LIYKNSIEKTKNKKQKTKNKKQKTKTFLFLQKNIKHKNIKTI
jgi:hypothetical protein